MKIYLVAFIPAVLLALAVITYVDSIDQNSGKGKNQSQSIQTGSANGNQKDSCCMVDEGAGRHSDNSIYQLNSEWKDQNGNTVKLKNFSGKKVVLAMIYTSCPTACPVIVNNMQRLESVIPQNKLKDYHFVLVSIDPDRDTPKKLNGFASERNLDSKSWTLLTGSKNNIAELAELIGFRYKKNANGNFTHSNLITFLDKDGVIMNQSEGLEYSTHDLLAMLGK